MRQTGKATKYAGIEQLAPNKYRVRARVKDPRTGKAKEVDRIVEGPGLTVLDAVKQRATWIADIKSGGAATVGERKRVTFSDFARYFIEAKRVALEPESAEVYASALNSFAALGDLYLDAITTADIQVIVKGMLDREQMPNTVRGKVKVLRSMFHFALKQTPPLLDRDPSDALSLPKLPAKDEDDKTNQLTAGELARAMRVAEVHFPQHYTMLLLLAATGIRFTHISALKWEDIDFEAGVIRFKRKQVLGRVGAITAIKRCPKTMPIRDDAKPELKVLEDALRHQRQCLLVAQHPGLRDGWCFPAPDGTCNTWGLVRRVWRKVQALAEIKRPCSLHGLRHTFNDACRGKVDALVIRSITQHTNERQREDYSKIDLREKAAAVHGVLKIVKSGDLGGDSTKAPPTVSG